MNKSDINENEAIILIGDSYSGKTSILRRYSEGKFEEDFLSTVGIDVVNQKMLINDQMRTVRLWDTAGQERFHSLGMSFIKNADGIMLVYDITNKTSFFNISMWMERIKLANAGRPVILIGNKIDLKNERVVSTEEGEKRAENLEVLFKEVSAKDGQGIEEAFLLLETTIVDMKNSNRFTKRPSSFLIPHEANKRFTCCGLFS